MSSFQTRRTLDRRRWLAWSVQGGLAAFGAATGTAAIAVTPGDPGHANTQADAALRAGEAVVVMRHARTVSGIGDPPGFDLAVCATQRNLSDEGREQSLRIGAWFASRRLKPAAVRSSAWCRCVDTAALAFPSGPAGPVQRWEALGSTFAERSGESARQTAELRRALAARRGRPGFEVWVTHMVNIQALAGVTVAMGEALVLRPGPTASAAPLVVARWMPGA